MVGGLNRPMITIQLLAKQKNKPQIDKTRKTKLTRRERRNQQGEKEKPS